MEDLILTEKIESKIYLIRGKKAMLDRDLAELYGVKTFVLNQAVKRNIDRFPEDFMFQLTWEEIRSLRSQIVILKSKKKTLENRTMGAERGKHTKYLRHAFTEQGIAMLSSVLRSKKAIQMNVAIMRAFVKLRQVLSTHKELAHKLDALERRIQKHDVEIYSIFRAIRKLMEHPEPAKKKIGFVADKGDREYAQK